VTDRKKLIEVALPLEAINRESAREKSIRHGHPSTLHLWWARRPLAACRAVIFASLVDDPSSHPHRFPTEEEQETERRRLLGIIERLVTWESTNNEGVLDEARTEIRNSTGTPPALLDPFCGGGSIPLEAQRLGLEAYASDLNPVAVLITKALVEIPPRFAGCAPIHPDARRGLGSSGTWKGAGGLAEDVRRYGSWMREEAERRIGHMYPPLRLPREAGGGEARVGAWLWARVVRCPNPACGAPMPLVRSFVLSSRPGQQVWVEPIVDTATKTVRFRVQTGEMSAEGRVKAAIGTGFVNDRGKQVQATFLCPVCRTGVARGEYIDGEANSGRMGALGLAVVAEPGGRRAYAAFSDADLAAEATAASLARGPDFAAKLPSEPARGTFASNAQGRIYGFKEFKDYFAPRQLVALATFSKLVAAAREQVLRDAERSDPPNDGRSLDEGGRGARAYADAVATYLAFAVDRAADYWSTMATWTPSGEFVGHTFTRQAIAMTWDYAEVNPFAEASGNWLGALDWIGRVLEALPATVPGQARQLDAAAAVNGAVEPAVCTDPPYYNNIGYSDLSDYFYVWLRRSIGTLYPDLFSTVLTPKAGELVASPYRFGGDRRKAQEHFERGLGEAFGRLRETASSAIPITMFYAFKQAEADNSGGSVVVASTGWETMLEALLSSGLAIVGTWPMRTERGARRVSIGANALASSILLVCRPRAATAGVTTRRDFVASLKAELPGALRRLQQENIAPVDLAQSSIGPGMAVFSRYAKVIEPDGSTMSVRSALGLINSALDQIVAEQEGEFDSDTRWAITWFEQHAMRDGSAGDAITLTTARDTSLEGLERAGIVRSGGGKVRLLRREELPDQWDPAMDRRPTVWEATQHLARTLQQGGEARAGELASRIGGYAELARDLAYRLYLICDRKAWADEATAYNDLVVAWPEIERLAKAASTGQEQQNLNL